MLCVSIQVCFCIIKMRRYNKWYVCQFNNFSYKYVALKLMLIQACVPIQDLFILIWGVIANVMCTKSSVFLYYLYAAL